MTTSELTAEHLPALGTFFETLPEGDVTFIKEDLRPEVLRSWTEPGRQGRRWVEVDEQGRVFGFVAMLPLRGWSSHVGELRLVVHPEVRGQGVGRRLAQLALRESVGMDLTKVVVEVVAAQQGLISMFSALGFVAEALLEDHIRDRDGRLQDIVLLAHTVDENWNGMAVAGVDTALASS